MRERKWRERKRDEKGCFFSCFYGNPSFILGLHTFFVLSSLDFSNLNDSFKLYLFLTSLQFESPRTGITTPQSRTRTEFQLPTRTRVPLFPHHTFLPPIFLFVQYLIIFNLFLSFSSSILSTSHNYVLINMSTFSPSTGNNKRLIQSTGCSSSFYLASIGHGVPLQSHPHYRFYCLNEKC